MALPNSKCALYRNNKNDVHFSISPYKKTFDAKYFRTRLNHTLAEIKTHIVKLFVGFYAVGLYCAIIHRSDQFNLHGSKQNGKQCIKPLSLLFILILFLLSSFIFIGIYVYGVFLFYHLLLFVL